MGDRQENQAGRRRRARSIALSDAEWEEIVLAAGAEALDPGANRRDNSPAAWARRVLLREAARCAVEAAARREAELAMMAEDRR